MASIFCSMFWVSAFGSWDFVERILLTLLINGCWFSFEISTIGIVPTSLVNILGNNPLFAFGETLLWYQPIKLEFKILNEYFNSKTFFSFITLINDGLL